MRRPAAARLTESSENQRMRRQPLATSNSRLRRIAGSYASKLDQRQDSPWFQSAPSESPDRCPSRRHSVDLPHRRDVFSAVPGSLAAGDDSRSLRCYPVRPPRARRRFLTAILLNTAPPWSGSTPTIRSSPPATCFPRSDGASARLPTPTRTRRSSV